MRASSSFTKSSIKCSDASRDVSEYKEIISLLVVDDHLMVRDMIANALEIHFPQSRVDTARDLGNAIEFISRRSHVDVVLLDYRMPDMRGFRSIQQLRRIAPKSKIIIVSGFIAERDLEEFRKLGVAAAVTKDLTMAELAAVVRDVLDGRSSRFEAPSAADAFLIFARRFGLTARESQAFQLMVSGLRNARIAADMGVTEATAKVHLHNAYNKLNVRTRVEAYEVWREANPTL